MAHTVFCVKFKKEMPGLDEPPFDNELGKKVYDNVSQEAWKMWRALQDVAQRVPVEPGAARGSGSHREAVGYVFLRRGIGETERVRGTEGAGLTPLSVSGFSRFGATGFAQEWKRVEGRSSRVLKGLINFLRVQQISSF